MLADGRRVVLYRVCHFQDAAVRYKVGLAHIIVEEFCFLVTCAGLHKLRECVYMLCTFEQTSLNGAVR